ncbi:MAG TPA: DUF5325 family protein [Bacilli bacterium]
MSRGWALFFAIIGIALLAGVGIALSFNAPWISAGMLLIAILFIGSGFVVKAKMRRN